MTKTPEQMAEEWISNNRVELMPRPLTATFIAGYKAGRELTDQEIVDIIVDIRKREAEERNKLPAHQEQRHARIWEKIKVKMIGIF